MKHIYHVSPAGCDKNEGSLEAPFRSFTAEEVGADAGRCGLNGSPTQVVRSFTPDRTHRAEYLTGTTAENADAVKKLWKEVR